MLEDNASSALLVQGIHKGVQETDSDALHSLIDEGVDLGTEIHFIEGFDDVSLEIHPFLNVLPEITGDKRSRLLVEEIVDLRSVTSPKFKDIAKSLRRDKPDASAFFLNDRIEDHGAAMHDRAKRAQGDTKRIDALDEAIAEGPCGPNLFRSNLTRRFVMKDKIDKSSANINCQSQCLSSERDSSYGQVVANWNKKS